MAFERRQVGLQSVAVLSQGGLEVGQYAVAPRLVAPVGQHPDIEQPLDHAERVRLLHPFLDQGQTDLGHIRRFDRWRRIESGLGL
jgi:hypothetical protein